MNRSEKIREYLTYIYGPDRADELADATFTMMEKWQGPINSTVQRREKAAPRSGEERALSLSERDAIVITYGDQFHGEEKKPLDYLAHFMDEHLDGITSGVHILPFFPYSSDDGFSIIDYRKVDPELGSWDAIRAISDRFRLMADLVLNHCSQGHQWFQAFCRNERPYASYFISVPPGTDVSTVVRPRALPLLTSFATSTGEKLVWTTFSEDQVDLNFGEPAVYLEMLEVLLFYVSRGVQVVRLDAVAYLWKELGTPCIHHPKTHAVVKLFREVLSELAPSAIIITETNVPHAENVSYFGNGSDEAQMVYQFALPPLTMHAFTAGDAAPLSRFARELEKPEGDVTFFNFLASHDGVGVLPARGYLTDAQVESLIQKVQDHGGLVSYKATPSGSIPYEMNINYFDAVADPALPDDQRVQIFLASQAIMLAMPGVPGIYIHSLIGSGNWTEGVRQTGHNRSINRQKLSYVQVREELADEDSVRHAVFVGYRDMLMARSRCSAFHPLAEWTVVDTDKSVFAIIRKSETERVLCLHNVTHESAEVVVPLRNIGLEEGRHFQDIVSGDHVFPALEGSGSNSSVSFGLDPYEVLWLSY